MKTTGGLMLQTSLFVPQSKTTLTLLKRELPETLWIKNNIAQSAQAAVHICPRSGRLNPVPVVSYWLRWHVSSPHHSTGTIRVFQCFKVWCQSANLSSGITFAAMKLWKKKQPSQQFQLCGCQQLLRVSPCCLVNLRRPEDDAWITVSSDVAVCNSKQL